MKSPVVLRSNRSNRSSNTVVPSVPLRNSVVPEGEIALAPTEKNQ